MKNYKNIGYYNGFDAIRLAGKTPDEIIAEYESGQGAFHTATDAYIEDEDFITSRLDGLYTSDEEFIVVYNAEMPLNLIGTDLDEVDEDELRDEFIDIYQKLKE